MPLGAAIGAGANLIGGLFGSKDRSKDRKLQKEFAQHGIRWKVEDAKAAGIHPLAALGAQTTSYSPVSVGGSSVASGLAASGQDISRAIDSTRTGGERVSAFNQTVQDLTLKRMGLENDLLASQIARITQAGRSPPGPSATDGDRYLLDGQSDSPLVKEGPLARTTSAPGIPSQEPGAIPDVGYARTSTGYHPVFSKDVKDRLEEDLPGMILWNVRNRLLPTFGANLSNPGVPGTGARDWNYHPGLQEYRRIPRGRGKYGFSRYMR